MPVILQPESTAGIPKTCCNPCLFQYIDVERFSRGANEHYDHCQRVVGIQPPYKLQHAEERISTAGRIGETIKFVALVDSWTSRCNYCAQLYKTLNLHKLNHLMNYIV